MHVGIIILSWNSKSFIGECLRGVLHHEPQCRVYVVDNGSTDGSVEYLVKEYPSVRLIQSPGNLGFAGGNNVGIRYALAEGCSAVALLNNDTVIDEPFLGPCVKVLQERRDIGIVGPIIVEANEPDRIQCRGGRISAWRLDFAYIGQGERYVRSDCVEQVDYVLGAAMVIRREVIERTGGLDPEFYPAYVEEADLCYRARLLGFDSVVCHASRVRHLGGRSSGGNDVSRKRYQANLFRFALKHLGSVRFLIATPSLVLKVALRKLMRGEFI